MQMRGKLNIFSSPACRTHPSHLLIGWQEASSGWLEFSCGTLFNFFYLNYYFFFFSPPELLLELFRSDLIRFRHSNNYLGITNWTNLIGMFWWSLHVPGHEHRVQLLPSYCNPLVVLNQIQRISAEQLLTGPASWQRKTFCGFCSFH